MKGSDLLDTLPCQAGQAREDAILEAVKQGHYVEPCWSAVRTKVGEHEGVILVSSDALKLGEPGDCFRPNVSAATAQRIADELGCLLPTTLICDRVHEQATARATPCIQPADPSDREQQHYAACAGHQSSMADTPAMLRHSEEVDAKLENQRGLASNVGKCWVITNRLLYKPAGTAANYGWFDSSAPYTSVSGLRLWQPLSTQHNDAHTDYSQVQSRLVYPVMLVDGESRDICQVGMDPELCALVSSEGVVKLWRLPSVPDDDAEPVVPVPPTPADLPELEFERLLRLIRPYMRGEDVAEWQTFLRIPADGVFGPQTDSATRAFQSSHLDPATGRRLVVDGVVGPASLRAANDVLRERSENSDGDEATLINDFVQAANFTDTDRSAYLKHIVIHTAEIEETLTAAEALASWVSGPNAPQASWHYAVDADSIIQSVHDELIAWHAPGANRTGIGIELAGYARQTPEDWADEYSLDLLELLARLVAHLSRKWSIPLRFVDRDGLVAGDAGITTHNEVTYAWHKTDHTDPGPGFPMDWLIERATELQLGYVASS